MLLVSPVAYSRTSMEDGEAIASRRNPYDEEGRLEDKRAGGRTC